MIIVADKPAGMTSQQVVSRIKYAAGTKIKIGHTGTLDPMCTGVLPVLTDNDTKLADLFNSDKEYIATVLFGIRTDTQDITGKVIETKNTSVSELEFSTALSEFVGVIDQMPPMYSAIKINGRKLYDLARDGIEIERSSRQITIYEAECLMQTAPNEFRMRINCSKGTYIRTLCDDIGTRLGCGGTMTSLRRTVSNGFVINDAHTLDEIIALASHDRLDEISINRESVFSSRPFAVVPTDGEKYYNNGGIISYSRLEHLESRPDCAIRIYNCNNKFLGLAQPLSSGIKSIWQNK